MKNSEIKYNLSTDYDRLYELLIRGNMIVGFGAITLKGKKPEKDHSKLVAMNYADGRYDLGVTVFFKEDFDKSGFIEICKHENIRFIDIDETFKMPMSPIMQHFYNENIDRIRQGGGEVLDKVR